MESVKLKFSEDALAPSPEGVRARPCARAPLHHGDGAARHDVRPASLDWFEEVVINREVIEGRASRCRHGERRKARCAPA